MSTTTHSADLSSLRISREHKDPDRKNPGNRSRLILALVVVAVAVAAFFLIRNSLGSSAEVELATATLTYPSQASAVLSGSGYVVAQKKAAVASKGTGRLEYLGVEEGDRVKKGQIIARLEDGDVQAALLKARADLQYAIADSLDAAKTLARQQTLMASGLTSQADLDLAGATFNRVRASILGARANVDAAEVAVENTRIRAPFDGTVLTKNADVGEVVAPFAASADSRGAVVTMADMNSLEVEADVAESNITRVKIGQPCEIVLDAYPDKRYQGFVHKIVPTADRAKATVLTKVRFREKDERVLPEMSAKITFLDKELDEKSASAPPALTVPGSSVVTRDGSQRVFLVRDGKVTGRTVRTGKRMGDRVEITEGLSAGDRIVREPAPDMRDGISVTVKE
jgi:HlyD family secretion protein